MAVLADLAYLQQTRLPVITDSRTELYHVSRNDHLLRGGAIAAGTVAGSDKQGFEEAEFFRGEHEVEAYAVPVETV